MDVRGLRAALDALYAQYDRTDSAADPVHIVRRFAEPADREIVGFLAAGLAFGRVASVLQSVEAVLQATGPRPAEFVRGFDPVRDGRALLPLGHRWVRGRDLVALFWVLRSMLERAGSLHACFLEGHRTDAADVGPALDAFGARALACDLRPAYGRVPARPGVAHFFPRPSAGSACKRLNLFLRWMVRRDEVDFGIWPAVAPAQLVIPLDTHIVRVGQCLRLTRYASPGWRMAADITASLREVDATDPVRYDFALCHLGMTGACGFRQGCRAERCPLRPFCRPRPRRRAASRRPFARR